jgi:hypothetical protein
MFVLVCATVGPGTTPASGNRIGAMFGLWIIAFECHHQEKLVITTAPTSKFKDFEAVFILTMHSLWELLLLHQSLIAILTGHGCAWGWLELE